MVIMSGSSTAKGSSPDDVARAPDGMAEAERLLLGGEGGGAAAGRGLGAQRLQRLRLAALLQRVLELVGHVEMVLDHLLVAGR